MMRLTGLTVSALLVAAISGSAAGDPPTTTPAAPAAPTATQPAATQGATDTSRGAIGTTLAPEAQQLLQKLEDRKTTLNDFTAKVDYSVEHISGDEDGKIGTVDYIGGATPKFSIDFTRETLNGKPRALHHSQIICDGKTITAIDFPAKQWNQSAASTGTGSLESEVPLPIGVKVKDVTDNFKVEPRPSNNPDLAVLRLTPLQKGKFKYTQLDLTIDKKLDLPVKIVVYSTGKEVTTIKFLDPQVNTGKAKVLEAKEPTEPDWTINKPESGPKAPAGVVSPPAK